MPRIGRMTYAAGSIAFIFIGLMHTYVHFAELAAPSLKTRFDELGPFELQGSVVSLWDLFQGVSLLMGFFSIALGAVLWGALWQTPHERSPHPSICLAAIFLLAGIAVVGALYLSSLQLVGGILGIICFGIPLLSPTPSHTE